MHPPDPLHVCTTCAVRHYDNCARCFGFGLGAVGSIISASEAAAAVDVLLDAAKVSKLGPKSTAILAKHYATLDALAKAGEHQWIVAGVPQAAATNLSACLADGDVPPDPGEVTPAGSTYRSSAMYRRSTAMCCGYAISGSASWGCHFFSHSTAT